MPSKKTTYDWEKIQTAYVTDTTQTYKSLSKRFGPSEVTICRKSKKGKWPELRKQYAREKQIKTHKNLLDKESRQKADLITKMNKAHYDSQQGLKFLADKSIIADVNRVKEGKPGKLSARQIQSRANTNRVVQESQRLAMGINDKELNVNLLTKHLTPFIEKIAEVIKDHVSSEQYEDILYEFKQLFGENA